MSEQAAPPKNNKPDGRDRTGVAEEWARAFGISKERLLALVEEVVAERTADGRT